METSEKRPLWVKVCGDMTDRDRQNLNRATWRLALWGLSFVGASFLIRRELVAAGPMSWLLAAVPSLVAVAVLLGYGRYLAEADELQRKIQLQALALGFGGGLFAGFGYSVFQRIGAPRGDVTDAAAAMILFYVLGLWLGKRRYA